MALTGSFVLLLPQFLMPLGGDNEIYQSMAKEMLRYHWTPYVSSWDQNFPGIIYIHALSICAFGDSSFGFRLADVLMHLGACAIGYQLLRRWLSPALAAVAVLLFALQYASGGIGYAGEREAFIAILLIAILWSVYLLRDRVSVLWRHRALCVAAGLAIAEIIALRPSYALIVFPIVYLLWDHPARRMLLRWMVLGAFCGALVMLIPLVIVDGGLREFYLSTVRYNMDVWGTKRLPVLRFIHAMRGLKLYLVPAVVALSCLSLPAIRSRVSFAALARTPSSISKREFVAFAMMILICLSNIFLMGKYWPYHFAVLNLFIFPFAALGFGIAYTAIKQRWLQVLFVVAIVAFAYIRVFPRFIVRPALQAIESGVTDPVEYAAGAYSEAGFQPINDTKIARYVEEHSTPLDRIECVSKQAGIRWRMARKSATRFTTFYPIVLTTPQQTYTSYQLRWRNEFIDSLLSARPKLLILSEYPLVAAAAPIVSIHSIPGFDSLVMPHYVYDTAMGGYRIFRRVD